MGCCRLCVELTAYCLLGLLMMIEEVLKSVCMGDKERVPLNHVRNFGHKLSFVACIVLSKEMEIFHFSRRLTMRCF
uniref:Putative secreted protein n=1 Tax=Anopheles marajoara TaxID=58244 RepID=A0A2M4CCT2_9DIPT